MSISLCFISFTNLHYRFCIYPVSFSSPHMAMSLSMFWCSYFVLASLLLCICWIFCCLYFCLWTATILVLFLDFSLHLWSKSWLQGAFWESKPQTKKKRKEKKRKEKGCRHDSLCPFHLWAVQVTAFSFLLFPGTKVSKWTALQLQCCERGQYEGIACWNLVEKWRWALEKDMGR